MASLQKRKNKKGETIWVIYYRVGKKQKLKTVGKTDKRTAQQALIRLEADLAKGKFGLENPVQVYLSEFIKEFLEFSNAEKAKETYLKDKRTLRHFIKYFGDISLDSISIKDVEQYRLERLKSISEETVNLEFRHLKAAFNRARSFGYISVNPFASVKPIRVPESDSIRFLELEDIKKVRDIFRNDVFSGLIEFYLFTGARLKEPLSLTWEDVDFRRQTVKIRSVHTKAKKHRIISFHDDEELEQLLLNLPKRGDNLLFGPEKNEKQWSHWWVSRKISLKLSEAGFPWATCHTFRHTFISHLVMQGVPLLTVKELVGHADISTTMKYAHLAPKHKEEMMGKRPY